MRLGGGSRQRMSGGASIAIAKELFVEEFAQTIEQLSFMPAKGQRYRLTRGKWIQRVHAEDRLSRVLLPRPRAGAGRDPFDLGRSSRPRPEPVTFAAGAGAGGRRAASGDH